jgi:nucleoside-diphosphate-sugar epimerase
VSKVLITGGGGFIGGHLAGRLERDGHEVHLVDNFARGVADRDLEALLERPSVSLLERDLLDPAAVADLDDDYDLIFHLAAIVGVANVLGRPYDVLHQNMVLLLNLLDLAQRQRDLGRFVFASTSEIYAGTLEAFDLPVPTPETSPITVPDVRLPRTSYMLSKLYGEALCLQADLPATIVRPHNFYGPRMGLSHVIPELLQRAHDAADGDRLEVYSVDHRRTFCFIDDAIELLRLTAESPDCVDEQLNVGREGPEVEIGELARLVVEVVGRDLEIVALPATAGSPPRRAPDMTKTTRLAGYAAQVDLADGVRRTYDWYREKVFGGAGVSAR